MGETLVVGDAEDILVPEDTILRAQVVGIMPREMKWNDRQTGQPQTQKMYAFSFEIKQDGPFKNMKIRGECKAKLTMDSTCVLRNWAMVLLQRELPAGMGIDIDDLMGLYADITVRHREAKDHSRMFMEVDQVMSVDGAFELAQSEPPF